MEELDGFPTTGSHSQDGAYDRREPGNDVLEFGWTSDRRLSGRRKRAEAIRKAKPGSFESMGFSVDILRGIKRKGYQLPTPIQRRAMPAILAGADVVGMARTGSGKTAAFVLPMLQRLGVHALKAGARAVILAPTRELALQTSRVVTELGKHLDLRLATLVGGDSMEAQFAELAGNPDILVATPGRLAHHIAEIAGFSLAATEYCVFDEADRLFEMGFAEQLRAIFSGMPASRQTLLFSATMPRALAEFARAGLREPTLIRLDTEAKVSPDLDLAFFSVRDDEKLAALLVLLKEVIPAGRPTLIFASTRHHVDLLAQLLAAEGIAATYVYGTLDQAARKINIAKFRAGRAQFLVVTDVAARGIDIPLLDNVVNFDFPPQPKLFVHRVGRAARAGRTGTAYSLFTHEELPFVLDLHLFLGRRLLPAPRQSIATAAAAAAAADQPPKDTSLFGSFPLATLESMNEHLREAVASSQDLLSSFRSATKAFQLYKKTRPGPSLESIKRARGMEQEGIHPLLAQSLPNTALGGLEAQESLATIAAALHNYRPAQTVMQSRVAGSRAETLSEGKRARQQRTSVVSVRHDGSGLLTSRQPQQLAVLASDADLTAADAGNSGSGAESPPNEGASEAALSKAASKASARLDLQGAREAASAAQSLAAPDLEPSGCFKQSGLYISHARSDRADEAGYSVNGPGGSGIRAMEAATLDILGEDAESIQAVKGGYHWDKRHRRYVQLQPGEQLRAGKRIRAESGAATKVKDGKAGTGAIYDKWAKAQKQQIPKTGASENKASYDASLVNRFKRGGRGWSNPLKAPHTKGTAGHELKTPNQVIKERKLANKKAAARAGSLGKGPEDDTPRKNTGGRTSKKGVVAPRVPTSGRASLGVKGAGVVKGGRMKGAAPRRRWKGDMAGSRGGNSKPKGGPSRGAGAKTGRSTPLKAKSKGGRKR